MEPAGRLGRIDGIVDRAHDGDRAGTGLDHGWGVLVIDPAHRDKWAFGDGGDGAVARRTRLSLVF